MAEESKDATIKIPSGAGKQILAAWGELKASLEAELDDAHRTADSAIKLSETRIAFYDKIVLLAGGSFALSLTFLGALQRTLGHESHVKAMWSLKTSWVLLMLAIVLSWLHNRKRIAVAESITAVIAGRSRSHYDKQRARYFSLPAFRAVEFPDVDVGEAMNAASKLLEQSAAEAERQAQDMKKVFIESWANAKYLGDLALLSIVCAFILMFIFALKNSALL